MVQAPFDTTFDPVETGAMMREARESLNSSLSEISADLRIRESYLQAIEEGRLSDLPGPAYTSGFLRTYGDYLKLDGSKIAIGYKTYGGGVDQHTSLSMPAPVEEGRLPTGSVLMIAGVLAILAYSVWYYISSSSPGGDSQTEQIAEESQTGEDTGDSETASGEPGSDASTTQSASSDEAGKAPERAKAGEPKAKKPAAEKPRADTATPEPKKIVARAPKVAGPRPIRRGRRANTVADEAVATSDSETSIRVPSRPPSIPASRLARSRAAPVPVTPAPAAVPANSADPSRVAALQNDRPASVPVTAPVTAPKIVVRAKSDSWVEVRRGRESPVLSRMMRAGETFEVPREPGYLINTGNAGAIEILVNGRKAPPIGRQGQVTRDIALDAQRLMGASTPR